MDPRDLARNRAEEIKDGGNFEGSDRIAFLPKFTDGEVRHLRVVPPRQVLEWILDNPEKDFDTYCAEEAGPIQPWREIDVHFNLPDGAALPCRKMINEACPPCEVYEEDIESSNATVKKNANLLRKKHQFVFFVEWRDSPEGEDSLYVWSVSPRWGKKILGLIANNDYTVLYDPFVGHDIRVERFGKEKDTVYDIAHRPQETFLYETEMEDDEGVYVDMDFEKVKEVLEKLPDIAEYQNPILSYDEYDAILTGESSVKEVYKEHFATEEDEVEDDGTEFDPEKLEKEEKEETPTRRRRAKKSDSGKRRRR